MVGGLDDGLERVGEGFRLKDDLALVRLESHLAAVRPDRLDTGLFCKGPELGVGGWG